jgi:alpha-L-rhamnosidase
MGLATISHEGYLSAELPFGVGAVSMAPYGSGVALALQGKAYGVPGAVWFSTYTDGSGWSDPRQIASVPSESEDELQCWDPALHIDGSGTAHLFFTVGAIGEGRPSSLIGMMSTEEPDGSFRSSRELPKGILGPTRSGSGVTLDDGTVLFGVESDTLRIEAARPAYEEWEIVARIADEDSLRPIEPSLCRCGDRGVLLCRSGCGSIVEVWSEPGLREWKTPQRSTLPNPRSKVEGITLADGRVLLVYNHSREGRTPLNVAIYGEEGWRPGPELAAGEGRFSFPAAAQAAGGEIHVVFTDNSITRLKHVILTLC